MANPVLIEVTRNRIVESRHRGTFVVIDAGGTVVVSAGDIDRPVYPRSAVKALQALPLVENGWADRFGLTDGELALVCASHSGEPIHTEAAATILAKAGLTSAALECGVHWPTSKRANQTLIRQGLEPSTLHNNCSGKHAGFLCLACGIEAEPRGYIGPDHPVQRAVKSALADVYGTALTDGLGTDGCSIPTYAVPLRHLARAFARLGTGVGFGPARQAAATRLRRAVAAHPIMIAGQGRLDTRLGEHFRERVFTKTGAEGRVLRPACRNVAGGWLSNATTGRRGGQRPFCCIFWRPRCHGRRTTTPLYRRKSIPCSATGTASKSVASAIPKA